MYAYLFIESLKDSGILLNLTAGGGGVALVCHKASATSRVIYIYRGGEMMMMKCGGNRSTRRKPPTLGK